MCYFGDMFDSWIYFSLIEMKRKECYIKVSVFVYFQIIRVLFSRYFKMICLFVFFYICMYFLLKFFVLVWLRYFVFDFIKLILYGQCCLGE